jgi:hypothetical protein
VDLVDESWWSLQATNKLDQYDKTVACVPQRSSYDMSGRVAASELEPRRKLGELDGNRLPSGRKRQRAIKAGALEPRKTKLKKPRCCDNSKEERPKALCKWNGEGSMTSSSSYDMSAREKAKIAFKGEELTLVFYPWQRLDFNCTYLKPLHAQKRTYHQVGGFSNGDILQLHSNFYAGRIRRAELDRVCVELQTACAQLQQRREDTQLHLTQIPKEKECSRSNFLACSKRKQLELACAALSLEAGRLEKIQSEALLEQEHWVPNEKHSERTSLRRKWLMGDRMLVGFAMSSSEQEGSYHEEFDTCATNGSGYRVRRCCCPCSEG